MANSSEHRLSAGCNYEVVFYPPFLSAGSCRFSSFIRGLEGPLESKFDFLLIIVALGT